MAIARLVKDSAFRFQETNGDYIKGNCYGCWGRFNHKKGDPRCRKGMVAEILIHSYFEGALLDMYLLEKKLAKLSSRHRKRWRGLLLTSFLMADVDVLFMYVCIY